MRAESEKKSQLHIKNPDGIARVWAYIGDDIPTRGDSHGAIGLARNIAEKLNGQFLYVDQDMLDQSFPDTHDLYEQLQLLMNHKGTPDIVIGVQADDFFNTPDTRPTLLVSGLNERLSAYFKNAAHRELVAHHLHADMLAAGGEEFRQRHPDISGPIIAVFPTDLKHDQRKEVKKLVDLCKNYKQATLYLCPCRRTIPFLYENLCEAFKQELSDSYIDDRIRLIAPEYNDIWDEYNPYIGLIDQADHAIIIGDSQSIVSEAIAQGRPIYADISGLENQTYPYLSSMGYVRKLHEINIHKLLDCDLLPPINLTDKIGGMIAAVFHEIACEPGIKNARPKVFSARYMKEMSLHNG